MSLRQSQHAEESTVLPSLRFLGHQCSEATVPSYLADGKIAVATQQHRSTFPSFMYRTLVDARRVVDAPVGCTFHFTADGRAVLLNHVTRAGCLVSVLAKKYDEETATMRRIGDAPTTARRRSLENHGDIRNSSAHPSIHRDHDEEEMWKTKNERVRRRDESVDNETTSAAYNRHMTGDDAQHPHPRYEDTPRIASSAVSHNSSRRVAHTDDEDNIESRRRSTSSTSNERAGPVGGGVFSSSRGGEEGLLPLPPPTTSFLGTHNQQRQTLQHENDSAVGLLQSLLSAPTTAQREKPFGPPPPSAVALLSIPPTSSAVTTSSSAHHFLPQSSSSIFPTPLTFVPQAQTQQQQNVVVERWSQQPPAGQIPPQHPVVAHVQQNPLVSTVVPPPRQSFATQVQPQICLPTQLVVPTTTSPAVAAPPVPLQTKNPKEEERMRTSTTFTTVDPPARVVNPLEVVAAADMEEDIKLQQHLPQTELLNATVSVTTLQGREESLRSPPSVPALSSAAVPRERQRLQPPPSSDDDDDVVEVEPPLSQRSSKQSMASSPPTAPPRPRGRPPKQVKGGGTVMEAVVDATSSQPQPSLPSTEKTLVEGSLTPVTSDVDIIPAAAAVVAVASSSTLPIDIKDGYALPEALQLKKPSSFVWCRACNLAMGPSLAVQRAHMKLDEHRVACIAAAARRDGRCGVEASDHNDPMLFQSDDGVAQPPAYRMQVGPKKFIAIPPFIVPRSVVTAEERAATSSSTSVVGGGGANSSVVAEGHQSRKFFEAFDLVNHHCQFCHVAVPVADFKVHNGRDSHRKAEAAAVAAAAAAAGAQ
ncbi:Hypothetical protein, putative [Bodo saltans]|uniref:Uncharacterized protein n=1 Tax=Bodo saltans TaxID=75058 RepID=A0A0S4JK28_BODSA|nr:Hypothetical protein, putative [Bodo saltans]|eukprot:CUG89356.1 Hypothetical protein, putative [Bodo saltans]